MAALHPPSHISTLPVDGGDTFWGVTAWEAQEPLKRSSLIGVGARLFTWRGFAWEGKKTKQKNTQEIGLFYATWQQPGVV